MMMSLTNLQLRTVHIAAKQVGLDDQSYRVLLRNVAGVASAKDLDNVTFEDVMATLEDLGYRDPRKDGDYWRGKVARRGSQVNERMLRKIISLAERQRYRLSALCRQFSGGRTERPDKLTPREAWNLIEMLKSAISREASGDEHPRVTEDCHVQLSLPM
jgi:phage gp16-like protein